MSWTSWVSRIYRRFLAVGGLSDLRNPTAWLQELSRAMPTSAGINVGPESALELGAYFACLRIVSQHVAMLPLWVYRRKERGKDKLIDHPVSQLLHNAPNPWMSAFSLRETLTHYAMGWGNGYALIERDGSGAVQGRPVALWPVHPSRLRAETEGQEFWYQYFPLSGETRLLDPMDVLHIHGIGGDGLTGYSVAHNARRALGIGLATEEYGGAFFGNGVWGSGALKSPGPLKDKAKEFLKESLKELRAGPSNAFHPLLLEEGLEWQQLQIPPEDAQFLQTRNFTVQEIARWFGVPPHKIGHLEHATFSNIEHQAIEYVQDALMPWLVRWEQECKRKLLRQRNLFVEHIVAALLRGDQKARSEFYRTMLNIGTLSPNDVRELENLDAVTTPGADDYFMQSNMSTLEQITDPPEPAPSPFGPPPPPGQEPEEDGEEDESAESDAQTSAGGEIAPVLVSWVPRPEEPAEGRTEPQAACPGLTLDTKAIRGLVGHTARRVVRRQIRALSNQLRHQQAGPEFERFANRFFCDQRAHIATEFGPVLALRPGSDRLNAWLDAWQPQETAWVLRAHADGTLADVLEAAEPGMVESITTAMLDLMEDSYV
jgi:HK97 family phage portal protein